MVLMSAVAMGTEITLKSIIAMYVDINDIIIAIISRNKGLIIKGYCACEKCNDMEQRLVVFYTLVT